MNVLAVIGSPRKGHTYHVVKSFEDALKKQGNVNFECILLKDLDIRNCRGCGLCLEKGEEYCPLKDDFEDLFKKFMNADGFIMATPVYSLQVTALLKNLLDRMAFIMHRPCFFHKLFMSIVTQGVYGADGVADYLDTAAKFFGFNLCQGLKLTLALKDPLPEETQRINREIDRAAQRFYEMLTDPKDPVPGIKDLLIFRMVRSTHLKAAGLIKDHQYYKEHGWLSSDYYYEVKLNPIKKLVGLWADWQGQKIGDKTVKDREKYRSNSDA